MIAGGARQRRRPVTRQSRRSVTRRNRWGATFGAIFGAICILVAVLAAPVSTAAAQGVSSVGWNEAPIAIFHYVPEAPVAGQSVLFDGSDSYDPDGTIVRYRWDFTGDGRFDAEGMTTTWTFAEPGTYPVTLLVVDNDDTAFRVTETIRVGRAGTLSIGPVEATFTYRPETPRPGQLITFDATASVFAGDGIRYEWDLDGDGHFEAAGPVVSRRYERDGMYRVTLRISDRSGRMATQTRVIQVGQGLVRVVLESDPSDVDVYIDGVKQGRTPLTLELQPGRHRLHIRHLWRGEWESELDLRFVEELALRIVLR